MVELIENQGVVKNVTNGEENYPLRFFLCSLENLAAPDV